MFNTISNWIEAKHHALAARAIDVWVQKKGQGTTEYAILAVSYTHLTLPTILRV